jgi:hypothetical protein
MEAAVIAALAALAGVVLGQILNSFGESTKWLREHRSVAYAAFIGAAERYLSGVLAAKGADDFRTSYAGTELDRIYGDIQVFGSEAAYLSARRVRDELLQIHTFKPGSNSNIATGNDFDTAVQPTVQSCLSEIDVLRSCMKRELRVRK